MKRDRKPVGNSLLPLLVLEDVKPLPDEYFDLLLDAVREAHEDLYG